MALPPLFLQGPTTFHVATDKKAEALVLLQTYFNEQILPGLEEGDKEAPKPFASIEEALFTLGWEARLDASGSVSFLSFTDRYFTGQDEVLAAIALCVTAGSSLLVAIEQQGQHDFTIEGWFFNGMRLHRERAIISFPRAAIGGLLQR